MVILYSHLNRIFKISPALQSYVFILCRYDHPHIIAGQGTLGLEIVEQVYDIDAVIIPVGGGGLIAGVALAVKTLYPNCKIIVSFKTNFRVNFNYSCILI